MKVTIDKAEYEIDVKKAVKDGYLKPVNKPIPGEVWQMGGSDVLILHDNKYSCISTIESGRFDRGSIWTSWLPEAKKLADNIKQYYLAGLAGRAKEIYG